MEPVISLSSLFYVGKIIGSVTAIGSIGLGVLRVISWVKKKFINIDANVMALKATMEAGFQNLSDNLKDQTTSVVSELKEQRQDFRTFYAPILMMQQQSQQAPLLVPARAKRSIRKKK